MNEWMNEWTNKPTNERAKEGMTERPNEQKEGMNEQRNEWLSEFDVMKSWSWRFLKFSCVWPTLILNGWQFLISWCIKSKIHWNTWNIHRYIQLQTFIITWCFFTFSCLRWRPWRKLPSLSRRIRSFFGAAVVGLIGVGCWRMMGWYLLFVEIDWSWHVQLQVCRSVVFTY